MIPEPKRDAVAQALTTALGTPEWEDIRPLTGGLSNALVYRIVVRGAPYVLRLTMPNNHTPDPARQFHTTRIAAEAGLAPRIRHANIPDGVLLADFVEPKPYPHDMALRMAALLRRVHALDAFPPMATQTSYFAAIDVCVGRFRAKQVEADPRVDALLRGYAAAAAVYPHNDDLVACHNDLRPENILFDGERVWLIDWEAGFLNDRYVDLSVVANFFLEADADEDAYLGAYFGEPVGDDRRARFYLIRQIVSVFYVALLASIAGPIRPDMAAPDFRDFHRRLVRREVPLDTTEGKRQQALAHLERAVRNMASRRFDDALARVAALR